MQSWSGNRDSIQAAAGDPRGGEAGHTAGRSSSTARDPIDVSVGNRIRIRRTLLGLSQKRLGDMMGLTFQQVQKYERGVNRLSASRLYHFSQALEVPVTFLFEDLRRDGGIATEGTANQDPGDPSRTGGDHGLLTRETLELVRAFGAITRTDQQARFLDLVKAVAGMATALDPSEANRSER